MNIKDIKDELFGDLEIEKENQIEQQIENNQIISFKKIKGFENNPFKIYDDEKLEELAESIKDDGLLSPILLWKIEDTYIILSGHNRFNALKMLGYEKLDNTMYKIIENISQDDAMLIVADANLVQRQKLLPSEKAKAYEIQQNALKNKSTKRSEVFAKISEENALNIGETAEDNENGHDVRLDEKRNIRRYLRLNYLIPELLEKVDNKEISLVLGVELSYLKEDEQMEVFKYFLQESKAKLNMEVCRKIREKSEKMQITYEILELIVESLNKPKKSRTFKLNFKEIREISKRDLKTDKDAKDYILECVKFYEENNKAVFNSVEE